MYRGIGRDWRRCSLRSDDEGILVTSDSAGVWFALCVCRYRLSQGSSLPQKLLHSEMRKR